MEPEYPERINQDLRVGNQLFGQPGREVSSRLEKRFAQGLSFLIVYTIGRALDTLNKLCYFHRGGSYYRA